LLPIVQAFSLGRGHVFEVQPSTQKLDQLFPDRLCFVKRISQQAPVDAGVALPKFLVRAGYIRQLGAGIYSYFVVCKYKGRP
jgi:hypothetical protein